MKSLFGDEIPAIPPHMVNRDAAHPAPPGTGPDGETCGTCVSCCRVCHHGKTYFKCALRRVDWTYGTGTDIRRKDKACREWEEIVEGLA